MQCKRCGTALTANTLDNCPHCERAAPEGSGSILLTFVRIVLEVSLWSVLLYGVMLGAVVCLAVGVIEAPVFFGILIAFLFLFFSGLG